MTPTTVSRSIRALVRAGAFVLLAAPFAFHAGTAHAADGVSLSVQKGPGASDLTLDWTGGQPAFDVYRSTMASGLVAPGNLVTSTSSRTLTTGAGTDAISFFIIASPCVVDPPERCDGVDNDCNGVVDDPGAAASCTLPNATAACVSGACTIDFCDGGYVDCDTTAANGCETVASGFPTDPLNCGGCGTVCPPGPNATAACTASSCGLVCNTGFSDCNTNPADGCEVSLSNDPVNCGSCFLVCPVRPASTRTCVSSSCSYTCNGPFVDCDGLPPNGCEVNSNSFPNNSRNCGGCGIVCPLPNGLAVCSGSTCQSALASCNTGFYDLNGNAADGCEYACTATGVDLPDDAFVDANCDGIDGDVSAAVFVSPGGNDSNAGTRALPLRNVSAALTLASTSGKNQIYVDQGLYPETVSLINGISIYGGYSSAGGWSRSAANVAEIRGLTASGGALRGVVGSGITSATTLDRLKITTASAPPGAITTYALHCNGCSGIVVKNCTLQAGSGSAGSSGAAGTTGANGGAGGGGLSGDCDSSVVASGGAGGASTCSRGGGGGGSGGYDNANGTSGFPGVGPTAGGTGGLAGNPGAGGNTGNPGAAGSAGTAGPGGSGGSISGGLWVGTSGVGGADGLGGNAGGGGGGGGGQNCFGCFKGTGNGGGGGGAGGCGGTGATPGGAGGGSFGAFFVNTTGFTLLNSTIQSGIGGVGGSGSSGGTGGSGGAGGAGAQNCTLEVGRGGNGGGGGAGGTGGTSGGGAGGPSWSVYRVASVGTISGCTLTPGSGGSGGTSPGNSGSAGASGTLF